MNREGNHKASLNFIGKKRGWIGNGGRRVKPSPWIGPISEGMSTSHEVPAIPSLIAINMIQRKRSRGIKGGAGIHTLLYWPWRRKAYKLQEEEASPPTHPPPATMATDDGRGERPARRSEEELFHAG
jgi:hypothetical protein